MTGLRAVLKKDLRVLFLSPTAWVFLSGFLFVGGLLFVLAVLGSGEASLRPMVPNLALTLLFTMPLLTMRSFAFEARTGTLELLTTAPVSVASVVAGKWLAVVVTSVVLLGCTLPWAGLLWAYGDPDGGALVATYLGLWLCACAFSAAGLLASSVTQDQTVAGILTVLLLLPLWLAGPAQELASPEWIPILRYLSLGDHLRSFSRGVLDSGDIAWFVGFTAWMLLMCWRSVESRRWR